METNMMSFILLERHLTSGLCGGMALFTTDFLRTQSGRRRSASTPASRHSKLDVFRFGGFGEFQAD